jgi:hypothetical protein
VRLGGRQDAGVDVDELYGLPPERFVPERNALAHELRRAGRRDEAADVAALRKPSVAARAVNQLARDHAPQLRRLFEAGDALSEVQSQVLAGQADGRTLGEAAERERAAVSALVDAARELLVDEGQDPSATVLERVSETLHAAALEDEARQPVAQGRLERELRHVGLGMGAGGGVHSPAKTKRGAQAPKTKAGKQAADSDKRAEQAAARRRAEAHKRAEADEADARRQAERAAKALQAAERRRSRAADALEEADTALNAARRAAKAGEEDHRKAERELRRLEP